MLKPSARSSSVGARWHCFFRILAAAQEDVVHVINEEEEDSNKKSKC